uniref:Beta'-coat protein n=1 Tax=Daucus carota subsp. sativus TaxID=79200 RepID=A0A164ZIU9_DAUCS
MNEFERPSERVKCVDLHPTQPWALLSLYSGTVCIWNYQSQETEKSFKITESPVRCAKFIRAKDWFVAGADDKMIHVYNYSTEEKIKEFEAHTDYIRSLDVHPSLPYVLSSSDDKLIKLWDWEKGWECTQTFEGHDHYVMQAVFNPKETNTFASASLDAKTMIWNLGSPDPKHVLEGHSKGVNTVEFFVTGDKSFVVTGSDDFTAKVWDYQTGTCLHTLEGHTNNVTSLRVLPNVPNGPLIITGSEDATIRVWNATTYRVEKTIISKFGRVWTIGCMTSSAQIVAGCDQGTIIGEVIYAST